MAAMELMRTKIGGTPLVLALLAVLAGAGYERLALHHAPTARFAVSAADTGPAELDPAFTQKLADRMRGPYERSR